MNQNKRVDAYIAKTAPFAQPILQHLRELVHTACPEVEESIKWGHISFGYHGRILSGMAAFKGHATFGFWHQEMKNILARDGFKTGDAMGLMGRITRLADLPADKILLRYIRTAVELHDSGAAARPAAKPKAPLKTPPDLARALKTNPKAAGCWAGFSPSARREYIEWITEARRPETRTKRLETTLEWLAAGKARNWKYENC